jgi:hypothetical protein
VRARTPIDSLSERRSLDRVLEVLVGILIPPAIFGVFAVLALWLGAESRPWFDERPVLDDRPNWWPIRRSVPTDADEEPPQDDEPDDGIPEVAPEPIRPQRPAVPTRAATSPSGV